MPNPHPSPQAGTPGHSENNAAEGLNTRIEHSDDVSVSARILQVQALSRVLLSGDLSPDGGKDQLIAEAEVITKESVENLFQLLPQVHIENIIKNTQSRLQEILKYKLLESEDPKKDPNITHRLLIHEAMSEAISEQIISADVLDIAKVIANTGNASQVSDLNADDRRILDRLSEGNANPVKVLIAFYATRRKFDYHSALLESLLFDPETGESNGIDASNAILNFELKRAYGADEVTAAETLAYISGKTHVAAQQMKSGIKRDAEVSFDHHSYEQKKKAFAKTYGSQAEEKFEKILLKEKIIGDNIDPMSYSQDLEDVRLRYFTLLNLTTLVPANKRIPLSKNLTKQLTHYREAIVTRQLQVAYLKKLQSGEDINEALDFKPLQKELFESLSAKKIPDNLKQKVERRSNDIWHEFNKDLTWYNEAPKDVFSGMNPFKIGWNLVKNNPIKTALGVGTAVGAGTFALSAAPGVLTPAAVDSVKAFLGSVGNMEFLRTGINWLWNTVISNPVYAGIIGAAAIATPFAWREIRKNKVLAIGSGIGAATVLIPLSILPVPLVGVGGFYAGSIFGPKILRGLGHIKNWFTNTAAPSAKKHLWDETSTLSGKKGSSSGGGEHGHGGGDGGHH